MKLKYAQAKMVTKVVRPTGFLQIGSAEPVMDDIAEITTWIEGNTENVLKAAQVDHIVKPGDRVTITIVIEEEPPNLSND